jgi:hypothetical protein
MQKGRLKRRDIKIMHEHRLTVRRLEAAIGDERNDKLLFLAGKSSQTSQLPASRP